MKGSQLSIKTGYEVNFDGLVGPTHNYSGLSYGNIASTAHKSLISNPLEAVLQGLDKMRKLAELGLKQAILPPQERPDIDALRRLGFSGSEKQILQKAAQEAPDLLSSVCSSSSMWTANAATVSPSADTQDQKVHFTPANLISKFHRSLEAGITSRVLKRIFNDPQYFVHHEPLPCSSQLGDEGAANHTRLCSHYGQRGVEFFVYGGESQRFPARQSEAASRAIARLHGLLSSQVVFAKQNPEAIDMGVFHNDVAGVGNLNIYFYHEQAYSDPQQVMLELRNKFQQTCGRGLKLICVPSASVSLEDAVASYLFNSQLVSLPQGGMALILPEECHTTPSIKHYLEHLLSEEGDVIKRVLYFNLKQSMRNGGGPACLRLRVVLTDKEFRATHAGVLWSDALDRKLVAWAKKYYRDRLSPADLGDPLLWDESKGALDELTQILGLGSVYRFQRG